MGPHLRGNQVKTVPRVALIPCDRDPYRKRGSGHRRARRDDPVRTRGSTALRTRGARPRGTPPCPPCTAGVGLRDQRDSPRCCGGPHDRARPGPQCPQRRGQDSTRGRQGSANAGSEDGLPDERTGDGVLSRRRGRRTVHTRTRAGMHVLRHMQKPPPRGPRVGMQSVIENLHDPGLGKTSPLWCPQTGNVHRATSDRSPGSEGTAGRRRRPGGEEA